MAQVSGKVESMADAQKALNSGVTEYIDELTKSLTAVQSKVEGSEWAGGALAGCLDRAMNLVTKFNQDYRDMQTRGDNKLTKIQEYLTQMDQEFISTGATSNSDMESVEGEVASLMP